MSILFNQDKTVSFLLPELLSDGASRVILNLARGFLERGLKVDLVVLKAEGDALAWVPAGVRIIELKIAMRGWQKFLSYPLALARYLRQEQPAVLIQGRGDINFSSIAKFLAQVQTKVIIVCHSNLSQYLLHCSSNVKRSPTAYLLRWFLWFYPWADEIVAVSQGVADDLEQLAGRPLKQIQVIYNPIVTPELLEQAKEPIHHPWFAPGQPPVILAVGRLQALKDFPTLIRAFSLVRQQISARLVILGEGEEMPDIKALINELGLAAEVDLPGFVSNPYAFMSQASVLAMPSRLEGFCNVIAESLACGTPVVSTDCPSGPAEILDFGKYGKLIPIADVEALAKEIITTITNPVNTAALKQRGQEFSLENAVNNYLELLALDYDFSLADINNFISVKAEI